MSARLRRVVAPLPPFGEAQLLAWLGAAQARGEPAAAWFDPVREGGWVAVGAAGAATAPDLGALPGVSSTLAELVIDGPSAPDGLLTVVVGAAFDPARTPDLDDPWAGWPGAWAALPRVVVGSRAGRSVAVLHLPVDAPAEPWLARVEAELADRSGSRPPRRPAAGHDVVSREERAGWVERVSAALRALERGGLHKLVLARGALHQLAPDEAWDVAATLERLGEHDARALRFAAAPATSAPGARGCFVGATPELLLRVDGGRVETVALAGTCRRGADDAEDQALGAALLASDKDRREHALVADVVRDALRPACTTLDAPATPALRRLRHVQHLETRFSGELRAPGGLLALAGRLHPTPAVAGAPRPAALAWLREHEALDRGWYAGAVGFVDAAGGGALAVAIRSALLDGARAWTFAGAGIVPGSDPAAEWEETALKLRTIERALTPRPQPTGVLA